MVVLEVIALFHVPAEVLAALGGHALVLPGDGGVLEQLVGVEELALAVAEVLRKVMTL